MKSKERNLVEILEHRAEKFPEKIVYSFLSRTGEEVSDSFSFSSLRSRSISIARLLEQRATLGGRVMLLFSQEPDFVSSYFGCLYAGMIPVPLQTPHLTRNLWHMQAIARDCGSSVLLTSSKALQRISIADIQNACPGVVCSLTDHVNDSSDTKFYFNHISCSAPALIQYTSGSTGSPKGVVVTHENLVHNLALISTAFGISETTTGVSWLPFFHDMGLIGGLLTAAFCGGKLVILPSTSFVSQPWIWINAISRYCAEIAGGPNSAFDHCAFRISDDQKKGLDLSSWRIAFNGSEPVRTETIDRFATAFAECSFRKQSFVPTYGLAEATLLVSGSPYIPEPPATGVRQSVGLVSSGTIADGQEVRIVDAETGEEVDEGKIGEIWIKGPSVAQGYWGKPEETRRAFHARLGQEGPYLRSGDLGFMKRGRLTITGRLKDILIVDGRNIDQQAIEQAVQSSHPALKNGLGAAFLSEDGPARVVVVHEVQGHFDSSLYQDLLKEIRRRIGSYFHLTVQAIVLVRKGSLPRTSSGKLRRYACRDYFRESRLLVVAHSGHLESGTSNAGESNAGELVAGAGPHD